MEIILASASPRRKELLRELGVEFSVDVPQNEETAEGATPEETAVLRSMEKAEEVKARHKSPCVVIGCDTVVVKNGKALGKPKDKAEALSMLKSLADGSSHEVVSGLTVLGEKGKWQAAVKTEVSLPQKTEAELLTYIERDRPLDKAGAYGIQDEFWAGYSLSGSKNNVVGLPTETLAVFLKKEDVL